MYDKLENRAHVACLLIEVRGLTRKFVVDETESGTIEIRVLVNSLKSLTRVFS